MSKVPSKGSSLEFSVDGADASSTNYFKFKNQFFATLVVSLTAVAMGFGGGFTSPAMEAITQRFRLDEQEVSLVTGLPSIGAIPSGFFVGALTDYFGRKFSIMLICCINAISWLLMISAQNVMMLYASRFISGIAVVWTSLCAPVYVTELSSPEIRGILGTSFQLSICIGILLCYILGTYISWQYLALATLVVPTVQIFLMVLLPESPTWLARHNIDNEVTPALKWLNRNDVVISDLKSSGNNTSEEKVSLKSFLQPSMLKPLGILCTLMFVQQFSGVGIVMSYAVSIFKSATNAISPNLSAIIIACSMLLACCVASSLVDKLGRKILLIVSGILMAIGMISLGTFYYFQAMDASSVQHVMWIPLVSLVIYEFAYGVGFGPVPWLMMGELFPNRARGMASSIVTTFAYTTAFITTKTFVDMKITMKDYGVFWMCGAVSVFAVFFTYFVVPETKGKTIDEIEQHFRGVKSSEVNKPNT